MLFLGSSQEPKEDFEGGELRTLESDGSLKARTAAHRNSDRLKACAWQWHASLCLKRKESEEREREREERGESEERRAVKREERRVSRQEQSFGFLEVLVFQAEAPSGAEPQCTS